MLSAPFFFAFIFSVTALPIPSLLTRADFTRSNGLAAQALNAKFKTLTASSFCTDGQPACVGGKFAQCVSGKFQLESCSAGTMCVALPLVNSKGTSITCDTQADALARIQATGVSGGLDGTGSSSSSPSGSSDTTTSTSSSSTSDSTTNNPTTNNVASTSFSETQHNNAIEAQKLNDKFSTLTADTPCSGGDQGCLNGEFAQCVNGKFQPSPCSSGTICVALPLVNKAGTSITCDTKADAEARFAAFGVQGITSGNGATSSPTSTDSTSPSTSTSTSGSGSNNAVSGSSSFSETQHNNALEAQNLNTQFSTLTADSPCTDGAQACVKGEFAQCVNGKFQLSPCSGGTMCVVLPLVNKAGTSTTCDTQADAEARFAAFGVQGITSGNGATSSPTTTSSSSRSTSTGSKSPPTSNSTSGSGTNNVASASSFSETQHNNALQAQKLNAQFSTLTADSPCTDGAQACVKGEFAQCVNGKFQLSPCAGGTMCVVLPLVNKSGTSTTCDTQADAEARFSAFGVNGLTRRK